MPRRPCGCAVALALLGLSLVGCDPTPRTALVVVVESTLEVPARIDAVAIRVTTPSGRVLETEAPLVGTTAVDLPASMTLEWTKGALTPVTVEAVGLHDGQERLVARAVTGFVGTRRECSGYGSSRLHRSRTAEQTCRRPV